MRQKRRWSGIALGAVRRVSMSPSNIRKLLFFARSDVCKLALHDLLQFVFVSVDHFHDRALLVFARFDF